MKKKTKIIFAIILILILIIGIRIVTKKERELASPGESLAAIQARSPTEVMQLQDGDQIEIRAEVITNIINGEEVKMYAYNGQIPGPILSMPQHASIEVDFKNNIDQPTTIHWHGLRHAFKDDGTPGLSQDPVLPGETFDYTVYTPDEGLYWYHPHVREDFQQGGGLKGTIWVSPEGDEYFNKVNKEEILVLDDLLMEDGQIVPFGKEHGNFALMGRFGNTLLINGKEDYELEVNQNDVIRFFILNAANVRPYNLTFGGAPIKLIGSDLGKYEKETMVDHVVIAPAERYIIEVLFEDKGVFSITNNIPAGGDHHGMNANQDTHNVGDHAHADTSVLETHGDTSNILGNIIVVPVLSEKRYDKTFFNLRENEEIIADIDRFRDHFNKEVDHQIDFTVKFGPVAELIMKGFMLFSDSAPPEIEWEDHMGEMNANTFSDQVKWMLVDHETGKSNMGLKYNWKVGDIIKIRLFNDPSSSHPMQHPFHMHGQRFLVLEDNGIPIENKVWKDTVLVKTGHTVDILVDVTNPGKWMMHCHIAEHLEAGMMSLFDVEE